MEIKKRNRAELKSYFVKNAIPTETNFADLMDAVLIQKSDGVAKLAGDTLSIEAVGDDNSRKPALSFYRSFSQPAPNWRVELNPWGTLNDPASAAAGLSISDSTGASRLFVSGTNGNVGVGTVAPGLPLHVRGAGATGLFDSTTNDSAVRIQTSEGVNNRVEIANRAGGRLALSVAGAVDSLNILRDGRVGIRTPAPERALHVAGTGEISLTINAGGITADTRAGLFWHPDDNYSIRRGPGAWNAPDYQQLIVNWPTGIVLTPGTGADAGFGRSYVEIRSGKGLRVTDGSVGIGPGTQNPAARLQVKGGAIMPEVGNIDAAGIMWPVNPGGGGGDAAFIRYWAEPNSETTTLRISVGNDPEDSLRLAQYGADRLIISSGQVTIDTTPYTGPSPRALNVPGEIKAYGAGAGLRLSDRAAPATDARDWVMYCNDNRVRFWRSDVGDSFAVDTTTLYAKRVNAEAGLHFGGNVDAHIESDGALYRFQGQAYLTVDDNFYIRDQGGDIKFWFDTNSGVLRQDDWIAAPLQQGWVNYGAGYNDAAYFRDRQGMVHLRGLVRSGQVGGNQAIFVLPAGFRPPARQLHVVQTADNLGRLDIGADGRVIPTTINNGWVSLDGIHFRVV